METKKWRRRRPGPPPVPRSPAQEPGLYSGRDGPLRRQQRALVWHRPRQRASLVVGRSSVRTIVKGKNFEVPDRVRTYAERKLQRLERVLDDRSDAIVEL